MARTDISCVVMISIELSIEPEAIQNLKLQLEKIIEVFSAEAIACTSAVLQKLALYKLSNAILKEPQAAFIQKYGADIVSLYPDCFVISKSGNSMIINELYRMLEGKFLLGFAQTGSIADTPFLESNDEWRISKLAA